MADDKKDSKVSDAKSVEPTTLVAKGDDKKSAELVTPSAAKEALRAVVEGGKPNLTRDQLHGFMKARAMNEGKSAEEAERHAKKRAAEMVSED